MKLSYSYKKDILWDLIGANGMTITNDVHVDSEHLLQQLGNWRFIADANRHALKKDPFLEEFLAFKVEMVEGLIEELQGWEIVGNQNKCKDAAENAQFFLNQIQVLVDLALDDLCEQAWSDSQKTLSVCCA
jgi:hypothetical protein